MRDDLYKTVPPTSNWRRVLRYACNKTEWPQAGEAMQRAIREEVLPQLDLNRLAKLRSAIENGAPDLLGETQVPAQIEAYVAQATTEHERRLGELLHGLWYRDGYRFRLLDDGIRELCRDSIQAGIEHCCALIRRQGEFQQAAIAKRELTMLGAELTFEPSQRKHKETSAQIVKFELPLHV